MGSSSGYVDIEVGASTNYGAKEQLINVYGADHVINLREIRKGSSGTSSFSSNPGVLWGLGLVGLVGGFLYFTPWFLMVLYGGSATWAAEKLTGQNVTEYAETDDEDTTPKEHKKAAIVLGSAVLFGLIGFIHGTMWNKDLNKEYNLDGKQSKIEQVQQK
jgi:hypothetical protein